MTILMLVWCIWLSVCVSGSDLPPFPVGGLDLPVGTGNPSWCIVCVCQRTPPLAVRYYELWRSEWLRDIRVDTVLQMQHVVDRVELAELGGCVIMVLTCELSWFVVTNPHVRVRRSSAANWGGMVMQEGRGVLASGVLAAGYCCHCRVGWEGMKGPGLFMWCTCCGEGIVLVIWGAGVWEETFYDVRPDLVFSGGMAGDWDSTFRNLRSFISRCLLDAAVIWSIGCWVSV